jgi:hypothetical protein
VAEKKEALRLLPTTHAAPAVGLATWGSPLSVYMACRNQGTFARNPEAPEKAVVPGLRRWASELLGRKLLRPRTTYSASGRLACLAGIPDAVTVESELALILRMPKPKKEAVPGEDPIEQWRTALETRELPLAERIECAALAQLCDWQVQCGVVFEGRLHIMEYKRDAKLESETAATIYGFFQAAGAGKVPAATDRDRETLKRLYPKHTAAHRTWKSLSADERKAVEQWFIAKQHRLDAEKAEAALEPRVLELIGEASGIELGGLGHFIERIDYMAKEAGPHAGTYKMIANVHLTKCISPKSAKALLDKHTPEVGSRSLKAYGGSGRMPGSLGGRIETIEQAQRASAKIDEIRKANPGAGSPDFKLLGDLCAELEAFDKRAQEAVSS